MGDVPRRWGAGGAGKGACSSKQGHRIGETDVSSTKALFGPLQRAQCCGIGAEGPLISEHS